jgi:hypothetical protein
MNMFKKEQASLTDLPVIRVGDLVYCTVTGN